MVHVLDSKIIACLAGDEHIEAAAATANTTDQGANFGASTASTGTATASASTTENVEETSKLSSPESLNKPSSSDTRFYTCDDEKLQALAKEKPWMEHPKHFQNVAVSPSAIMKMMMHCARGVEKGIAQNGNPIEVMGLLLGRPDPFHPTSLIVTDAFPLPIEGFETRVIADDQNVVNHMIALNESLELSRKERFMGWYHSHPFDLGDHSHCFLSQTDLTTQLQWQRAEDPHGNPFVAMVIDPLRSDHYGVPEIKAFRAFPPEYQSPTAFECPDGSIEPSEQRRLEHWGSCWNRYYELNVEYFMSSISRSVLQSLTSKYLWISNLKSQVDPTEDLETLEGLAANVASETFRKSNQGSLSLSNTRTSSMVIPPSSVSSSQEAMAIDPPENTTSTPGATTSSSTKTKASLPSLVGSLSALATQTMAQTTIQEAQQHVFKGTEETADISSS